MNIDSAYPSQFINASHLQNREVVVEIERLEIREIGTGDSKPCLFFKGKTRGLLLNRTNANTLSQAFKTSETADWIGRTIVLFPTETDYAGKRVPCIRVRVPAPRQLAEAPVDYRPPPPQKPAFDSQIDDEIPF